MYKPVIRSLALLSLVSLSLFAQPAPPPRDGGPDRDRGPLGRCLAVVAPTEAQKASIKSIFDTAAPLMKSLGEELRLDREALRTALEATTPEACAVGAAVLEVRKSEAAIRAEAQNTNAKIEALLTPDQKLKFDGCMQALHPPQHPPSH